MKTVPDGNNEIPAAVETEHSGRTPEPLEQMVHESKLDKFAGCGSDLFFRLLFPLRPKLSEAVKDVGSEGAGQQKDHFDRRNVQPEYRRINTQ